MKKFITFLFLFFISTNVLANEKKDVTFSSCVDGDTANVVIDEKITKVRFLAIDTPETKHPTKGKEEYGTEASNYTCNILKNASKLEIEYDPNSDKKDKYDRHLVWIFADDKLIQEELIKKGYAKVAYLYDDYKYTSNLKKLETEAQNSKIGIWSEKENNSKLETIIVITIIILFILLFIFDNKFRKKVISKKKRKIKKKINDLLG